MIRKAIKAAARAAGIKISRLTDGYDEDGLATIHNDAFRRRKDFRIAYARALRTLEEPGDEKAGAEPAPWDGGFVPGTFGQWRTHIALWCASTAARLDGDFVECGVFVGFMSSAVMKHLDWDTRGRMFYLIDTFAGPDAAQLSAGELQSGRKEEMDHLREIGGYRYSLESVQRNFREWKNVQLIKGLVPDILKECPAEKMAYLHIDMNCALPEVAALRFFWNKLVPGGMILLDDYAFSGFDEQHKAMDALAEELGVEIMSLPTGQGLLIKPLETR